jgi:putative restriction endonuclease
MTLRIRVRSRLRVSPRLRSEFGNGDSFYAKAGEMIALPERRAERSNPDFLRWHLDAVFKAS